MRRVAASFAFVPVANDLLLISDPKLLQAKKQRAGQRIQVLSGKNVAPEI
jgi:hypothetical protein